MVRMSGSNTSRHDSEDSNDCNDVIRISKTVEDVTVLGGLDTTKIPEKREVLKEHIWSKCHESSCSTWM